MLCEIAQLSSEVLALQVFYHINILQPGRDSLDKYIWVVLTKEDGG